MLKSLNSGTTDAFILNSGWRERIPKIERIAKKIDRLYKSDLRTQEFTLRDGLRTIMIMFSLSTIFSVGFYYIYPLIEPDADQYIIYIVPIIYSLSLLLIIYMLVATVKGHRGRPKPPIEVTATSNTITVRRGNTTLFDARWSDINVLSYDISVNDKREIKLGPMELEGASGTRMTIDPSDFRSGDKLRYLLFHYLYQGGRIRLADAPTTEQTHLLE